MPRGLPAFVTYPEWLPGGLPVALWEPGLSAVADELLGPNLRAELAAVGFESDRPEDIRTGLLVAEWGSHPAGALAVAKATRREPGAPFAVTGVGVGADE
jgi:hypothetical protein